MMFHVDDKQLKNRFAQARVMVVGDVMQGLLALGQQRTAQTAQVA